MVKVFVKNEGGDEPRFPFLRGILTRSLQDAGLTFDEAYALAKTVRDKFSDSAEVATAELREIVLKYISQYGPAAIQRYQHPANELGAILVHDPDGRTWLFSRERHRQVLVSSGLPYEDAMTVTSAIFRHLTKKGVTVIPSRQLGFLIYRYLRITRGAEAARRYLVLVNYLRGKRPLVLMIGGAPGTGKSALATELAQRLEIVRIQSTDLLREVMRMMIPERLIPVLHRSSYDAWKARPGGGADAEAHLIDEYKAQAELLMVPCEAVVRRSLHEEASLILEGVHVQHALIDKVTPDTNAIVIPIMLAVIDPAHLKDRFKNRGANLNRRRAERYLENFDSIWRLQSYLLSEADRWQTQIVISSEKEQVVKDAMAIIIDRLSCEPVPKPEELFS